MSSSDPAAADRNITAFFDTREAAEEAIGRIVEDGLPRDKILLRAGAARKPGIVEDKKSLIEEVKDLVLPTESPDSSVETLRHDGFLLTVRPDAETHDKVLQMLEQHGIGVESRDDIWPKWKSDPAENTADSVLADDNVTASGPAPLDDPPNASHEHGMRPAGAEPRAARPEEQTRTQTAGPASAELAPSPT